MPESIDFILRFTLFCIIHSSLAVPRVKQRIQELLGRSLNGYRLVYNLFSIMLFGWVTLAWQSTSVLYVPPGIWSLVLHGLQGLILWACFLCLRQTGLSGFLGTDLAGPDQPPRLVTTGWYGLVRHPLYLLAILFLVLNPVITTRWIVLTLLSIPYFIGGALLEERRMLKQFGSIYREYQRTVPFLFPRFRRRVIAD